MFELSHAASNVAAFPVLVAGALTALVSDHVVQGRAIMPGAGYLSTLIFSFEHNVLVPYCMGAAVELAPY